MRCQDCEELGAETYTCPTCGGSAVIESTTGEFDVRCGACDEGLVYLCHFCLCSRCDGRTDCIEH